MYSTIEELPSSIRESLPEKAQELYRAAYNRVWEKLTVGETTADPSAASQAHEAARLAVDAEFDQHGNGEWHHEPVGEEMAEKGNVPDPDVVEEPEDFDPER